MTLGRNVKVRAGLVALAVLIGCSSSKLSKQTAEEKIKKAYFDSASSPLGDALWCQVKNEMNADNEAKGTWVNVFEDGSVPLSSPRRQGCRDTLLSIQAIKNLARHEDPGGGWSIFEIGDRGKLTATKKLSFVCGKRAFKEIKSITTQDRNATVTYLRTVQLNKDVVKKVESFCELRELPKDGETEQSTRFSRDDDGNWSIVN